jgi:hypothetical protein
VFRYRLYSRGFVDLGTIDLAVGNLELGETFQGRGHHWFPVVDAVILEEEGPINGLLRVEPAADAQHLWRQ